MKMQKMNSPEEEGETFAEKGRNFQSDGKEKKG